MRDGAIKINKAALFFSTFSVKDILALFQTTQQSNL